MANPDENIGDVWAQTLTALEARPDMSPRQLAFIRLAKPMAVLDDMVFIAVPHEQTRTYLETAVRDDLVSAMSSVLGRDVRFGITVDPELSSRTPRRTLTDLRPGHSLRSSTSRRSPSRRRCPSPRSRRRSRRPSPPG